LPEKRKAIVTTGATTDLITTEIIRNFFMSCAQDMNATLFRSAYTPVIYEGLDCAVALLDENADVLGQAAGVPLFVGNLEVCVKLTTQAFGVDIYEPGDIFYMNDPYLQGTHLNDATIFGPIFIEGELVGFAATRAHWLDVGGKDPGVTMDSTEVYQEGVRWGPTKIVSRYQPREDLLDLLRRNSRFGYSLIGDMNAQIAACRTGEERLKAIIARFGLDAVRTTKAEIARQSAELDREAIAAIPDGSYAAEGYLDDDGVGDEPVLVNVRVEIAGDAIAVDLAGSAPATRGPVNCGIAQTISAVRMAYKLLIHPERPVDGGTFPTLTIHAPAGSIFNAQEPAACQWYFTPLGLMTDLIVKALAPAIPDTAAAAHYGDSMVVATAGRDPRRGGAPFLTIEPTTGGWGGYQDGDGQDALITTSMAPSATFRSRFGRRSTRSRSEPTDSVPTPVARVSGAAVAASSGSTASRPTPPSTSGLSARGPRPGASSAVTTRSGPTTKSAAAGPSRRSRPTTLPCGEGTSWSCKRVVAAASVIPSTAIRSSSRAT